MSGIEKLCLMTTEKMLRIAIHNHQKKYQGRLPKRIEMHPAVLMDLWQDKNYCIYAQIAGPNSIDGLHGVPIVVDVTAKRLKLININNEVEYI